MSTDTLQFPEQASPHPNNRQLNAHYTPTPLSPFEVHPIGVRQKTLPRQIIHPCWLTNFEIVWVKKGVVSLVHDKQETPLQNNQICLLTPGQLRYIKMEDRAEGYLLSLTPQFIKAADSLHNFLHLLNNCNTGLLPVLQVEADTMAELEDLTAKMKEEKKSHANRRPDVLNALFKLFLLYLTRNACSSQPETSPTRNENMAEQFLVQVRNNFKTKKLVADYAWELGITPNYLNQVVKSATGHSASHHIQEAIINHAKYLALSSDLSMKEIAYNIGFKDHFHFSKFFKNTCGMNFTRFKKQTHKNSPSEST